MSELSDDKLLEMKKIFSNHWHRSKGEFEDFGLAIDNIWYEIRKREKYKNKLKDKET